MSKINWIIGKIIGGENVNRLNYFISNRYYSKFSKYKGKKKIIYALVPKHKNMGDQAIAYATHKYLDKYFSEYEVIEVVHYDIYKYCKAIKRVLNKSDLIFIHGGGNLGTLYLQDEVARRFIIKKFKDNKIISMTQTVYFSNDEKGKREEAKTSNIYNSHPDLTLLAREEKSYEIMKRLFTNAKVIKCPDIVFSLENIRNRDSINREYITTCFRSDIESIIDKNNIINKLRDFYGDIQEIDTINDKEVFINEREDELYKLLNKFFASRVVITDRLHGMIFAVITKTPCIVTKSKDHKIIESYKWIKNLNYIKFINDLSYENIISNINEMLGLKELTETKFNEEYFNNLKESIL